MITYTVLGVDIYICTPEEARQLWKDEPEKRPRIFLESEFDACMLLDKADIEAIMHKKNNKPGYTYKRG